MSHDRRIATWLVAGSFVVASFAIALVVSGDAHASQPVVEVPRDARLHVTPPGTTTATLPAALPAALVELEESGEGSEAWSSQGLGLLDALGATAAAISEPGCFVAGCGAMFTFASEDAYQRQLARLVASDAYAAWTGGKVWSPLQTRADRSVVVVLLLYRPD
jgi:hypothetical protein